MKQQPQYYITEYRHSEQGFWEPVQTGSLRGAKYRATKNLRYVDGIARVGVKAYPDQPDSPIRTIAEKRPGDEWRNID